MFSNQLPRLQALRTEAAQPAGVQGTDGPLFIGVEFFRVAALLSGSRQDSMSLVAAMVPAQALTIANAPGADCVMAIAGQAFEEGAGAVHRMAG